LAGGAIGRVSLAIFGIETARRWNKRSNGSGRSVVRLARLLWRKRWRFGWLQLCFANADSVNNHDGYIRFCFCCIWSLLAAKVHIEHFIMKLGQRLS
jgi:hypothetical protein